MKYDYNKKISFARLTDEAIKNMRESLVLEMSGNALKMVSEKQLERVAVLNPQVHILLKQYKKLAETSVNYNQTAFVGEV